MNETITIVGGIEATVIATLLFTLKTIVLFFAIWTTIITLRGIGQLAGYLAAGRPVSWGANFVIVPSLLWTVFWILTQIPV